MRRIGVVTVARSDFGILRPVLREIEADDTLDLRIYASGMHLAPAYGMTVEEIEADGFAVAERVEMLAASDSPTGIATSMGLGAIGFGALFARERPDLLLVLGDRFEVHSAVVASLPFALPVAHVHGGESTEGLIDEPIRHSLTKMSHLHFPATELYARRVEQMGEEPWRITVAGAPGLDNLRDTNVLAPEEVALRFGLDAERPFLLVTYHPVTLEPDRVGERVDALLGALRSTDHQVVITHPNADTGRGSILSRLEAFAGERPGTHLVVNAGTPAYFGLMAAAEAMVGNSSSGIIEAASFKLPVVNIGIRQRGRLRPPNVVDTGDGRDEIAAGIARATSAEFRDSLRELVNPYGDGHAAERIVARLREVELDERLLLKRFHETGAPA